MKSSLFLIAATCAVVGYTQDALATQSSGNGSLFSASIHGELKDLTSPDPMLLIGRDQSVAPESKSPRKPKKYKKKNPYGKKKGRRK